MKLYGISGLEADKRVFEKLTLECEFVPLEWIQPLQNESIENYSKRFSTVIDQDIEYGILGVSFGGLIAVEISKVLNPTFTVLISSAETRKDLRPIFRGVGKTGIISLIPNQFFDPPRGIAHFMILDRATEISQLINKEIKIRTTTTAKSQAGKS